MATVIMLIVAVGVITALTFAARTTSVSAQRTRALNLATQYIERARNLNYDLIGTYSDGAVYGDPPGSIHTPDTPTTMWDSTHPAPTFETEFTVVTKISWQRSPAGRSQYKNVEVVVGWTTPVPGSVKLATSVFGKTSLSNVGDLELTFRDRATNAVIPGLSVSVTAHGETRARTVITDATGVAFYGMIPTGVASMTISTPDWVFDTSNIADVPVISVATGDVLSPFTIKGQKASSINVRVVGTHGDPLAGVTVSTVVMGQTRTGTTNGAGYVLFTAVPSGTYSLTATKSDREQAVASIVVPVPVSPGPVVTGSVTMHDPIDILFKVSAASSGSSQAGATVTLFTQAGVAAASGSTDADGLITFSTLVAGSYYATAQFGNGQGRYPATAGTYVTLSTAQYGNHDSPIGSTAGLLIQLSNPSIIRVKVVGTGGGVFPYVVPITVDGVSHNSVGGTWDFVVSEVRAYSVQATYTGYRPFGGAVAVDAYGQVFPITALLDSTANMTIEVRSVWGQALLSGAAVAVAGPESDSLTTGSSGLAAFTGAHSLYGTNQPGDSPYTVTVSKTGYQTGTLSGQSLAPGQTLTPNPVFYLTATRAGTFVMTTKNKSSGVIRPNAGIQVIGPTSSPDGISSYTVNYTSDASGKVTITGLPLGTYKFKYLKTGTTYSNVSSPSSTVLSSDGQTQTFDVKW